MGQFCPSCGFNLASDEPIQLGRWLVSADEVCLDGERVALTAAEVRLVHTVAARAPRAVRREAVVNRVSDACEADNVVSVFMSRLRSKLGADMPIETVRGVGLRWCAGGSRTANREAA
jgi:DNA-binding response OmpR family regulator